MAFWDTTNLLKFKHISTEMRIGIFYGYGNVKVIFGKCKIFRFSSA
jgi:hypothetical protein